MQTDLCEIRVDGPGRGQGLRQECREAARAHSDG